MVAVTHHHVKSRHRLAERAHKLKDCLHGANCRLRVHTDAERWHKKEVRLTPPTEHASNGAWETQVCSDAVLDCCTVVW
jgi:hypothetical protein